MNGEKQTCLHFYCLENGNHLAHDLVYLLFFFLVNTTPLNYLLKHNFLIPQEVFCNLLNYYKIVFNFVTLDVVAIIPKKKSLSESLILDKNSFNLIVAIYTENSLSKKSVSIHFPTRGVAGPCFPVPLPNFWFHL